MEGTEVTGLNSNYWQFLSIRGSKPGPLICVNVYLPPRAKGVHTAIWAKLEDLESIYTNYPAHPLILCDDFNARMGSSDQTMKKALNLEDDSVTPRFSHNKGINNYGKHLFTTAYKFRLMCFNPLDSSKGFYTYILDKGASVIDYIIGSSSVLPYVSAFEIEDRSGSDHLLLKIVLDFKPKEPQNVRMHAGREEGQMAHQN